MARNKFDIDEELDTPFNIAHFKRSFVYIKRYRGKMIAAFLISVLSAVTGLFAPLITKHALDVTVPEGDVPGLILLAMLLLGSIVLSSVLGNIRGRIMTRVGQNIIYDIREDVFAHLQKLPFSYYDSRPHGKILIRVINYVNSVSDILSNGIINFIMEILNMIFILIFMFFVDVKLTLVAISGLPVFFGVLFFIKKRQRASWHQVSIKSSNMTAYLQENISGARVTQIFTREEENAGIYDNLNREYRRAWMRAVKYSNLVWPATDNISVCIRAAMFATGLLVFGP